MDKILFDLGVKIEIIEVKTTHRMNRVLDFIPTKTLGIALEQTIVKTTRHIERNGAQRREVEIFSVLI